jgi:replicative DNA helicase
MSEAAIPTMPFGDAKQEAIVAWALHNPDFFDCVRNAVKPHDLTNVWVGRVYKAGLDFFGKFDRLPTAQEIQHEQGFTHADQSARNEMVRALNRLPAARIAFGLDVLKFDVERWMKAKLSLQVLTKFARMYNQSSKDEKKLDEALLLIPEAAINIESTSFEAGTAGGRYTASEDCELEQADRVKERIIKYGVNFLDDALGGMSQKDLVLVGAKTGAGKSQLVTAIAKHVAGQGQTVDMFALEAEKHEIARRIKFSMMAEEYYADEEKEPIVGSIKYGAWRRNELKELDRYEPWVREKFKKELAGLRVHYREDGIYDHDRLEKEIKAVAPSTNLIIIDHIHYVDIDGENENTAYKRIIKTIRDLTLKHGIPIIVVAHLRKTQPFRDKAIVPNNEDFHGTSDLTKVATTCILLGKAEPAMDQPVHLRPTYMRVTKSRIEGDLSWMCGLTEFDIRKNIYIPGYRLGMLQKNDSKFESLKDGFMPYWAQHVWGKQIDKEK